MSELVELKILVPRDKIRFTDVVVEEDDIRSAPFGMVSYTTEFDVMGYEVEVADLPYEVSDWDDTTIETWIVEDYIDNKYQQGGE